MKKKIEIIYFNIFLICFLEIMYHIFRKQFLWNTNLIYIVLGSFITIFTLNILSEILKEKASKIVNITLSIILTVYYIGQVIFYRLYSVPFSFSTIGLAKSATEFKELIIDILVQNIYIILIFFIPIILYIIFWKNIYIKSFSIKNCLISFGVIIFLIVLRILFLQYDKNDMYSAYNLYYNINASEKNFETFGVMTSTRLDLQRLITNFEETVEVSSENTEPEELIDIQEEITYNVMDIDFETLKSETKNKSLISAYDYINSKEPSKKNQFTGKFQGKNLIFILAEGFNSIAVDENLTPTLYKLCNSGFVFNNFYTPEFLSTTGGEFQATTGLIPTQSILSTWKKEKPSIKFALGNSFGKIGYNTFSYHNWTYNYYSRNVTMKTLGFEKYMAKGNGLEELMNCEWIPSDMDMIDVTTDFYIKNEPFVTYYVTVSAHAPYYFGNGNSMATKNKEAVSHLNYSTNIKAYLAGQIELNNALELLINKLDNAGILENTVIALVGDHYPYTISLEDINSISSYERDEIVEVNKSNFIVWNSTMEEKIEVNKVGDQIDVLPTLLNLFGIEYDSRTIIGQDILSDTPGMAIFSNRSWVTDFGTYFSAKNKFIPRENVEIEDGYVNKINKEIAQKFTMSEIFIKHNIYDLLFR